MLERSSESQIKRKQQKFDAQTTQAGEKCAQASQKAQKKMLERCSQVKRKRQKVDAQMTQAGESLRKQTKRHKKC